MKSIRTFKVLVGFAYAAMLLTACRAPPEASPLHDLPASVVDYKTAAFVENLILVIQVCLKDKTISVRDHAVAMPVGPLPPTVCKRRVALGQPCPQGWLSTEPEDAAAAYAPFKTVRVWEASGSKTDIDKRYLATSHVRHNPISNSAGTSTSYLRGTTSNNQPVFEYMDWNPRSLFAWSVTSEGVRNEIPRRVEFWFRPSSGLRVGEFSAWRSADSEETRSASGRSSAVAMANNADFPRDPTGPGSPYVRFGLFTYRQSEDRERLYRYEYKPAQLELLKSRGVDRSEKFQVLDQQVQSVPPC